MRHGNGARAQSGAPAATSVPVEGEGRRRDRPTPPTSGIDGPGTAVVPTGVPDNRKFASASVKTANGEFAAAFSASSLPTLRVVR